jgi:hypothetical protein
MIVEYENKPVESVCSLGSNAQDKPSPIEHSK